MSEWELAENLGRRFALLTSGGRDELPKMRTLRASLEWSYELLVPIEQEVLDRLSVFHGGCALPEATYVCGSEGVESWEVMEILSSLIEKSLVLRLESSSGRTRYTTLESITELGREHLQEKGTWFRDHWNHFNRPTPVQPARAAVPMVTARGERRRWPGSLERVARLLCLRPSVPGPGG